MKRQQPSQAEPELKGLEARLESESPGSSLARVRSSLERRARARLLKARLNKLDGLELGSSRPGSIGSMGSSSTQARLLAAKICFTWPQPIQFGLNCRKF
ncbi:hypothetical protein CRG98_024965 [Punica granatum]|uniref:Uncharacterized protein n=1 Tax=Punica granatum TaxID=22663 RepID=A0A2I0JEF7_PUNGR|nr:hypothetical protein CRG98_024965 [Punica granatum]